MKNTHLLLGKENIIKNKQNKNLLNAYEDQKAKIKEIQNIQKNKETFVSKKMHIIHAYDDIIKKATFNIK